MSDSETLSGNSQSELRAGIARIEACRKRKKDAAEDEKAVYAELKAKGYRNKGIRHVVRAREFKPNEWQEWETIRDTYMHAAGMAQDPPLFEALKTMAVDTASRDSVKEALKKLVPAHGEIVMKDEHGKPIRLWRDKDGKVQSEDWIEPGTEPSGEKKATTLPPPKHHNVPDCTATEAERMGEEARKENRPITDNPFPFGDARQESFELGWHRGGPKDE